jgi:predicted O-methyltransferase YrrM
MSVETFGVEWKRGELAEAAAREAGLTFKVAGSTGNQIPFHDMPEFYRTVDAVLTSSISEAAQLPVMEAAAAGRLVIGTPVGHFPRKAYQGGGILAPIEADKFKVFAAETLRYYKEHPSAYVDKCHVIQDAARAFDWQHSIGEWVELIETARAATQPSLFQRPESPARVAGSVSGRNANEPMPLGASDEQIWLSRWQQSRSFRDSDNEDEFVKAGLEAFRIRPHRAEPLHDLARYYLGKSRGDIAIVYADAGMSLPVPAEDRLGVEPEIYRSGLKEAFTIAASYSRDPAEKERGRAICNWLSLTREAPNAPRGLARHNYNWYAEAASSLMQSIQFHPVSVAAPAGFKPGNISIARTGDGFVALIRAVNYDLLDNGYFDRHGDTSFRQRTLLVQLDSDLKIVSSAEVFPPEDLPPPQHTDSLGFEDPRPIIWRGGLWCVSSVRQLNPEGRAEMVLARIDQSPQGRPILTDWRVLPSGMPLQWEKNWMPQVVDHELRFVYSLDPIRVLSESGETLFQETPVIAVENFRGGSQAIPFDGGWLMIIHEWQVVGTRRHYFHRFVWLDENNRLRRLSRRFFFRRIASEFAAGLAWHASGDRLVISFGTDDHDPALAVVDAREVRTSLLEIARHRRASEQACALGRSAWDAVVKTNLPGFAVQTEGITGRASPAEFKFAADWVSRHAPVWAQMIERLRPTRILEIGSFEGRSTCFFVEHCSRNGPVKIYCIDTWRGGLEHDPGEMPEVEHRFEHNVRIASERAASIVEVKKMKGQSLQILSELIALKEHPFDLIYIDGSHQAPDVLTDSILAFHLLRVGGTMIFDDYLWSMEADGKQDPLNMPKPAIDAFINLFQRKLKVIVDLPIYQLHVEKLAP